MNYYIFNIYYIYIFDAHIFNIFNFPVCALTSSLLLPESPVLLAYVLQALNPVTILAFCILLIYMSLLYSTYFWINTGLLNLFLALPSKGYLLDSGLGCQSSQETKNCCWWCCRDSGSKSLPGVHSSAAVVWLAISWHTDLKSHPELINGPILDAMPAVIGYGFPRKKTTFSQKPIADLPRMRTSVNVTFSW